MKKVCAIPECDAPVNSRGWCRIHYMRWWANGDPTGTRPKGPKPQPIGARFWAKVRDAEDLSPNGMSGCMIWTAQIIPSGYGTFRMNNPRRQVVAHRVAYELVIGAIPEGLELDHLCRRRCCVNPAHLEAVTHRENVLRGTAGDQERVKTHCAQGHPFTPENTYVNDKGWRRCRTCTLRDNAKRKAEVRAEARLAREAAA
jgi:hypothetical protein